MVTAAEFLKYLNVFNVQYGSHGPITIPVPMGQGGTGAVLTPTNNALFYSTAAHGALLASIASSVFTTDGSGNIGWNTFLPTGTTIANPTTSSEVANKAYVDLVASGLAPAGAVYAASTTDLGYTYSNGAAGVGATLTAPGNGVFTLDGTTPPVGQTILYKNDVTGSGTYNGIYQVTTSSAGSPAVLTRSTNYDTPTQINSTGVVPVINGSTNANSGWYNVTPVTTIGTDPLTYIQFGNSGTVTNVATGTGLTGGPITGTGTISFAPIADADLLANTSGGSAAPLPTALTALIDYALGSTQGDILYRNGTVWTVLPPGTAGQALLTGGAAANPSWGASTLAAIANNSLLANISGSAAVPSATTLTALIDAALGNTQGDVLYRNGTVWTVLPPGTAGQALVTGGAAANPSWTVPTLGTIAASSFLANTTGSPAVPLALSFSSFFARFFNIPLFPIILTGTTVSVNAVLSNIYIVLTSGLTTITIPSGFVDGQQFQIIGASGSWRLAQSQPDMQIFWGDSMTTVGTSGYVASNASTDGITVTCIGTDIFLLSQPQGSFSLN